MKTPPQVLSGDDKEKSLLLSKVKGQYRSPSGADCLDAYLGLYLNSDFDSSPYSFCYFGLDESFCGHHSPFSQDCPVEFAMLEAWHAYEIGPHYWEVPEPEPADGIDECFMSEFRKRKNLLRVAVDFFKAKEDVRQMVYGPRDDKFNADRLFYPDTPPTPDVEYSGTIEEMEKTIERRRTSRGTQHR